MISREPILFFGFDSFEENITMLTTRDIDTMRILTMRLIERYLRRMIGKCIRG